MADPFERVQEGDPLSISAAAWNRLLDVAQVVRARPRDGGGAGPVAPTSFAPAVQVFVKNTTGALLPARSVVTPAGVVVDPVARALAAASTPALLASAPTSDADPVCVTAAPIPNGGIGRAAVSGVAVCGVEVTDTAHRYARPAAGNLTNLVSAATGQVRLLQTFAEAGTYDCYVLLQGSPADADSACAQSLEWVDALRDTDCLVLSVTSSLPEPAEGDPAAVTAVRLTTTDGVTWTATDDMVLCGYTYGVTFDRDAETVTLTSADSGSGGPYTVTARLRCGGCDYAELAFDRRRVCPCAADLGPAPCDRRLRMRLEWSTCPVVTGCCEGELPRVLCGELLVGDAQGKYKFVYDDDSGYWLMTPDTLLLNAALTNLQCSVVDSQLSWVGSYQIDRGIPVNFKVIEPGDCVADGFDVTLVGDVGGTPTDVWRFTAYDRATCEGLSIPGYRGEGWYVTTAGVREILDADKCDPSIRILCGPYDTEAEADAAALTASCGGTDPDPDACDGGIVNPMWGGDGYYCSRPAGSVDPCEAVFLFGVDRCDAGIDLCSGPYATYAEAVAACAGGAGGGGEPAYRAGGFVDLSQTTVNQWAGTTADGTYTLIRLVDFGGWNLNYVGTGGPCQWHIDTWGGTGCATFLLVSGTCSDGTIQVCKL